MRRDIIGVLLALVCGMSAGSARAESQTLSLDPKPGGTVGGNTPAAPAASAKQVTFLAGTQRQIAVDPRPPDRPVSAFYLVQFPAGLSAKDVKVQVLAVMSGLVNELRLQDKLSAEVVGAADGAKAELRLDVLLDEPLPSGTYGVRVRFSLPGTDAAGARVTTYQDADVSLVLPPGGLLLPPKLVVELVDGEPLPETGFRLTSTSELSRVSILGTSQGTHPLNGGRTATGQLGLNFRHEGDAVALPKLTLRPGETGYAQALIQQPFPLGSTAGSLRIHARELASAVELPYEVRVRRGYGWLFGVALLGVFAGNGLRWLLTRLEELGQARSKLDEQYTRLRAERERHQDETFRSALSKGLLHIEQAFHARSAKALVAAFDESEKQYQAALKKLEASKELHVARLKVLRDVASGQYRLPSGLRSFATGLSGSLPPVAALLDVDDVTEAGRQLDSLEAGLKTQLASEGKAWSDKVALLLLADTPVDGVLKQKSSGVQRDEVRAAVESFTSESGAEGGLKERLTRLDAAWRKLADFVRPLVLGLMAELDATRTALLEDPEVGAPGTLVLAQALQELEQLRGQHADAPESLLEYAQASLPQSFRKAILACLGGVPEKDREEVSGLIKSGEYVQAATKAVQLARTTVGDSGAEGVPRGHIPESFNLPFGAPLTTQGTPSGVPSAPAAPSWWSVRSNVLGGTLAPSRVELTRYWQVARLGVMLFMGALLSAVTTALFADGWIGTWEDVLKVFVWASALDLTASSVTSTLARLKKEPGPGMSPI